MNKETRSIRFTATSLASIVASCALVGSAMAADVTVNGTSNNSNTDVSISNTSSVTVTNDSTTTVSNSSTQSASSGAVNVSDVAQSGNVSSGSASVSNATSTTINQPGINLGGSGGGMGGGSGSGGSGSGGSGSGGSNSGSGQTAGGMGGGSGSSSSSSVGGLGGGLGSVSTLPETGASVPVDVSALRALYHAPATQAAVATAAKATKLFSGIMLGLAAVLSLVGAAGSAIYTNKRSRLGLG